MLFRSELSGAAAFRVDDVTAFDEEGVRGLGWQERCGRHEEEKAHDGIDYICDS